MALHVTRYCQASDDPFRPGPDFIMVEDGDGRVLLDERCGPDGRLHPENADAARERPWFFTGSPFAVEILNLARARGVIP